MSVSTVGNGRIELSARTALVAVGDLLAIALFVGIGELTHGINPILSPARFAGTLTPFYVGWLLVAGLGGLYTAAATGTVRAALGALSWGGYWQSVSRRGSVRRRCSPAMRQ